MKMTYQSKFLTGYYKYLDILYKFLEKISIIIRRIHEI